MLTSSVLNSVTFKNLDGGNPNRWNTLHENRKQGNFTVIPYCQPFQKDGTIYLQFTSDSATVPVLKIYNPLLNDTVNGTLASSYSGLDDRYFFNFEIELVAAYYEKKVSFTCTQGAITLTSEPIFVTDLTEDIAAGRIKKVLYNNLDRNESDLSDYWVDWSATDSMYFYIEATDIEMNLKDDVEVLEGSQINVIISANFFSGIQLKTGGIPEYMIEKITAASSLDYFEVNDVQYIKDSSIEPERFGNSTLKQASINLIAKNISALNVDNLDTVSTIIIDQNGIAMEIIPKRNTGVTAAGWQVENPEGYMLHSVFVRHAATSIAVESVVTIGSTPGGSDILDAVQGSVLLADYPSTGKFLSMPRHYLKDADNAFNVYVSVAGAGSVLDIILNFDTVTQT